MDPLNKIPSSSARGLRGHTPAKVGDTRMPSYQRRGGGRVSTMWGRGGSMLSCLGGVGQ
jgi:hypothetical protein